MRSFVLQQGYPVPPDEVLAAQLHPALDAFLVGRVPDLKERTELQRTARGDTVERLTRCTPVPRIPEVASHVVKPHMIGWVEHAVVDLARRSIRVSITPDSFRDVFSFKGLITLAAQGDATLRRVEGTLEIRIFLVGRYAEDYIVEEIRRNMEAEGVALGEFIREGRHRA